MNIHLENGILEAREFFYTGVPMATSENKIRQILDLATRFAPLLKIYETREFVIDWDFYAKSGKDYQELMNEVLLALGVLTHNHGGNIRIVLTKDESDTKFSPKAYGKELSFHVTRYKDALQYIALCTEVFGGHGISISPHELEAMEEVKEMFHCNAPLRNIIITDSRHVES